MTLQKYVKYAKSVFKWSKNKNSTKIGRVYCNDLLENFIIEKQIKYFEYSDFKNITFIRENVVSANLKDDFFALLSFNNDEATLREVAREIELHENIVHENILQFYGITKKETDTIYQLNKYILVKEYAENGTLSSYLNEHFNKLNWNDKFQLAIQLASAVLCLHENDICHNNMHANNILVHRKNIKLADFGLPGGPGSIRTAQIFDMLPYIDPKSFDINNFCKYKLGKKSDVYSVGVILWQISSGYPPFHAQTYNAALVFAILGGQREKIVGSTPIGYSELYEECWKLEPDERPDMQQVVSILKTLINQFELPKICVTEDHEGIKDDTTKLIKKFLKDNSVNIIPFNELEDPVSLCKGGFGVLKKAVWRNKYVVYKKLINTTAIQYNTLDAFIHELKIHLLLLSSYNDRIIHCFGVSQDDKTKEYLIVTQYADGGDLRSYLENNFKKLNWNDKKKLAYQIADGLNYLHNEKVLHRDLHSKNIVIHENNVKIIDFGISKIQDQKSEKYMRNRGIIAYMEPKRLLDPNFSYEKYSDVYSFGVLMWEISSGRPPFKNNSFNRSDKDALVYAINNGVREKPIPGTPKEYEELYKNCWHQNPSQRPTTSEILYKFTKMGFGVVINAINVEHKSDEEKTNSDLQADLFINSENT